MRFDWRGVLTIGVVVMFMWAMQSVATILHVGHIATASYSVTK